MQQPSDIRKVAFLGDYLPRKCGIATFTTDLRCAVAKEFPALQCLVVPVNDLAEGYDYPPEVRFEIAEQDLPSYLRAADFLNITDVDVVCVEHEFGIFGGPAGSHVLALLRELQMPIVTTLHTILREPNAEQRRVMRELIRRSTRLVVMSERGREFLRDVYHAPENKIDLIPHGIPDMPFADPNYFKDEFGVAGKQVLLTFGLLSPNKGIEFALRALPDIIREFPNVVYIVLGQTHPNLLRDEGEAYRLSLGAAGERPRRAKKCRVLQPLRRAGGIDAVHRRGGHLSHAVSDRIANHFRHAGVCVRRGQRRGVHALLARGGIADGGTRQTRAVPRRQGHRRRRRGIAARRTAAPLDAQERLQARTRNGLEPRRATLRKIVRAGAAGSQFRRPKIVAHQDARRTAGTIAGIETGPSVSHERFNRHLSAREFHRAEFCRGLLHGRQRPRAWCWR